MRICIGLVLSLYTITSRALPPAPIGVQWCAGLFLGQPRGEARTEGEALLALNETIAALERLTDLPAVDLGDKLKSRLDRVFLGVLNHFESWGDVIGIQMPDLADQSSLAASHRVQTLRRLQSLHADVTAGPAGAIALAGATFGREEIIAAIEALGTYLDGVEAEQRAPLAARVSYLEKLRAFHAVLKTVPTTGAGLAATFEHIPSAILRQEYGLAILGAAGLFYLTNYLRTNGPEALTYLGGFFSSRLRSRFERIYDPRREREGPAFLATMKTWLEYPDEIRHALAYLTYGVKVSAETARALRALSEERPLTVDDVVATLRHHNPRKIPRGELRYVVIDHVLRFEETGLVTSLVFVRIKTPRDLLIKPPGGKRAKLGRPALVGAPAAAGGV